MKASPIQAKHIGFHSVTVTPRKVDEGEESGPDFDWNGVVIGAPVNHHEVGSETDDSIIVTLDVIVDNTSGKKKAPYNIDISAWGVFSCINKSLSKEDALDLVVVNGASMLYGSIRELLLNLTQRMTNNELMLPTAIFLDCKPSERKEIDPSDEQPPHSIPLSDDSLKP